MPAPIAIGATLLPTEPGNDILSGGPGDDAIDPGGGGGGDRDILVGDDGQDTVSYAIRSVPVVTAKDGVANDGQVGEGDNIGGDVERINGGLANDSVGGGAGADLLEGGPGADVVVGFAGNDQLLGDTGADTLRGGPGADQLVGGPNRDAVSYVGEPRATVSLDRGRASTARRGDRDRIAQVEDVRGGAQGDTVTGSSRANALDGAVGHDYVDGGRGVDRLDGGPERADVVAARDGARDEPVSCGPGQDLAIIDRKDRVARRGANRCEQVDDGSRTKPRPGLVYVRRSRCGVQDVNLGLPAMHRLVPLRYAILLAERLPAASSAHARRLRLHGSRDCDPGAGASASADVSGGGRCRPELRAQGDHDADRQAPDLPRGRAQAGRGGPPVARARQHAPRPRPLEGTRQVQHRRHPSERIGRRSRVARARPQWCAAAASGCTTASSVARSRCVPATGTSPAAGRTRAGSAVQVARPALLPDVLPCRPSSARATMLASEAPRPHSRAS